MSKNVALAGVGALGQSNYCIFRDTWQWRYLARTLANKTLDVGKHILDALIESNKFNIRVLSRSPKPELESKGVVVKVRGRSAAL
jgi:hypothetical protein